MADPAMIFKEDTMSTLYRIASRRWLLAYLGIAGVLAGEVMLLPHPSKLLFGPIIRGASRLPSRSFFP